MATKIIPAVRVQALELAANGYSERAIAHKLGISRSAVWDIKQAAKKAVKA